APPATPATVLVQPSPPLPNNQPPPIPFGLASVPSAPLQINPHRPPKANSEVTDGSAVESTGDGSAVESTADGSAVESTGELVERLVAAGTATNNELIAGPIGAGASTGSESWCAAGPDNATGTDAFSVPSSP